MHRRSFGLILLSTACATTHAEVDRTSVTVSDSSKIVSENVIPDADRFPRAVNHLGLAEEMFQHKLTELRERRDVVRSRGRALQATSYAIFAASTIGVGAISLSSKSDSSGDAVRSAGFVGLGGLAGGTLLQILGYMQEDSAAIDAKIQRMEAAHAHMIEELQSIAKAAPPPGSAPGSSFGAESLMGNAIENFLSEVSQINIRG